MDPTVSSEIISEIDRIRDQAQAAFIAREAETYMNMFSPDVTYKLRDGTVLTYERLQADLVKQLRVIPSIEITRTRDRFEFVENRFVEVVTQLTSISAPFLFLITRTIEMTRRGSYVWSNSAAGWRIVEVEILSDTTNSHWALGFLKPRRIL